MKKLVLEAKRLCFSYGEKRVLSGFDFSLGQSERVYLSAPSGAGKTTFMRLVAGLNKPDSGSLSVNGRVAYLFQEDRLIPWKRVLANLTVTGADREQAMRALEAVGLTDCANEYPSKLSGGMKRRVAIARLLCLDADILLLDEPFSGIDGDNKAKTAAAICEKFSNAAMILVTHLPEEAELIGASAISAEFIVK